MKLADQEALKRKLAGLRRSLAEQLEQEVSPLPPAEADQRRAEAEGSFQRFVEIYLPHYFAGKQDYSELHLDFFGEADRMMVPGKGQGIKAAWAAPRGNAKTSLAKALVLYVLVLGRRYFVVLISDALDQAIESLEAVKVELESNSRIKGDYPDVAGEGPVWNLGSIVTRTGVKIKAYGSGKRIRGATHGVHRPDLVIVDDLENDQNVQSPAQRDKGESWMLKSVEPLGPPDGSMDLWVLGTVLHYDAVLVRLMKNPEFQGRIFKAIQVMPARLDLWDEFERLYWQQGRAEADRFFAEHKSEMDRGAKVLWPQVQSLVWLMAKRAQNRAAFASEYQNNPIDEADRVFDQIHFYDQLPNDMVTFGAVDPSMGKENRSADPCAIIVVGRSQSTGKIYVLDATIAKVKPSAAIDKVIDLQRRYGCHVWAVEVIQFQEFFKDELVKKSAEAGTPVPARGVRPSTDKGLRIESLEPHINNGVILLSRNQTALIDQLTHYPKADHDDGPDALHMAFSLAHQKHGPRGGIRCLPPSQQGRMAFGGF